jgi:hypothetical protein
MIQLAWLGAALGGLGALVIAFNGASSAKGWMCYLAGSALSLPYCASMQTIPTAVLLLFFTLSGVFGLLRVDDTRAQPLRRALASTGRTGLHVSNLSDFGIVRRFRSARFRARAAFGQRG